jgi:hypothetical protein
VIAKETESFFNSAHTLPVANGRLREFDFPFDTFFTKSDPDEALFSEGLTKKYNPSLFNPAGK